MIRIFDQTIKNILNEKIRILENEFNADVAFFYGEIHPGLEKVFRDFIEELKNDTTYDRNRLVMILNTPGGSAEIAEKLATIMRHNYQEIYFIVPDAAMSAGTILCMSGDKIYMDYSSSLGPIDPQVYNGKNWVPALGYLDKVESLLTKSLTGNLSDAEYVFLRSVDLAELRSYEMARDLTIALLKDWLVNYKFKDWNNHSSTGLAVTLTEKQDRAKDIASKLSNNSIWHSHGRSIGISTLKDMLKLKIEDFSSNPDLRNKIREYNDLICEHIIRIGATAFLHSRVYF
ncbi:hypothetical protein GCM10023210_03990 [Chryseobacterium ginsengisoli]|uniref:Serine dehydrogenasease n=1 Tax=Chryseobacterium ginsengisoli TaxID=363853 RepID=A0ABP9LVU4_9FLAO